MPRRPVRTAGEMAQAAIARLAPQAAALLAKYGAIGDDLAATVEIAAGLVEKAVGTATARGRFEADLTYRPPLTVRISVPLTFGEADDLDPDDLDPDDPTIDPLTL